MRSGTDPWGGTVRLARHFVLSALLAVAAILGAGCAVAPAGPERTASYSLAATDAGPLADYGTAIAAGLADGDSAYWLLDRADFSFRARLALVDKATSSLDLQYFIWERDPSSRLFSRRVLHAADRGVKVRILLDDLTLVGHDAEFVGLDKHPNIEVRTFNPFRNRSKFGRFAEFAVRFGALNHRMHNKTVIADGHFAIMGGRNIGDRYFGTYDPFVQNDLDVLTVGPLVEDVASSFDLYWNSSEAYYLDGFVSRRSAAATLDGTTEFMERDYLAAADKLAEFAFEPRDWTAFLDELARTYVTGAGRLEQDLPWIDEMRPTQLYRPFRSFVSQARRRLLISSPYFIPDDEFVEVLERLHDRGVRVIVLTNSLASNNHTLAHLGYRRWRKRLLEIGVELYESRHDSSAIDDYQTPPTQAAYLGLHSKAVVVDERRSYVGSANVDPRSLIINTELGFFVESTELAEQLEALIGRDLDPANAWRVTLDERGKIRWESTRGTLTREPALGPGQRIKAFFINFLPFKNQA